MRCASPRLRGEGGKCQPSPTKRNEKRGGYIIHAPSYCTSTRRDVFLQTGRAKQQNNPCLVRKHVPWHLYSYLHSTPPKRGQYGSTPGIYVYLTAGRIGYGFGGLTLSPRKKNKAVPHTCMQYISDYAGDRMMKGKQASKA